MSVLADEFPGYTRRAVMARSVLTFSRQAPLRLIGCDSSCSNFVMDKVPPQVDNLEWSTPSTLVPRIRRLFPNVTSKQVHSCLSFDLQIVVSVVNNKKIHLNRGAQQHGKKRLRVLCIIVSVHHHLLKLISRTAPITLESIINTPYSSNVHITNKYQTTCIPASGTCRREKFTFCGYRCGVTWHHVT